MDLPFHNRLAFTGEGPALLLRPSHCSSQAFISNLPYGKSTVEFSSADASGSTSQAANILEAIEVGASVLLIDEVPFPDPPLAFSLPAGHRRDQLHDTERGDATTGGQRQRTDHPVHCQGSAFGPPGQCPPPPPGSPPQAAPCPYVVRDSHLGHQLLLPPANWCPIFAFRTTHAVRPVGLLLVSSR